MALLTLIFTLAAGPSIGASLHIDIRSNTSILDVAPCTDDDINKKDLDVVIFGATGFVGQLAVDYLSKGHPDKPHWAIAGRSEAKLAELFQRYNLKYPATSSAETIVADATSLDQMLHLAKRTKTILSFAGPYENNGGEEVIRAAINGCAHYVDLAGETLWKSHILDKYDEAARQRGIAIVQSAGFFSMAADFLAASAAEDMVKQHKRYPQMVLVLWDKLNSQFTGGQVESIASNGIQGELGLTVNPYILVPNQVKNSMVDAEPNGFSSRVGEGQVFGWDQRLGMVLLPYNNAAMDCSIIRRSMDHLFPGQMISVKEAKTESVDILRLKFEMQPSMALHPHYPKHPVPGQGPDEWLRDLGSASATAFAFESEDDSPGMMVHMEAIGDPSTIASPRMAVEIAVGLAQTGVGHGSVGYLTPATALRLADLEHKLSRIDGGKVINITHFERAPLP